MIFSEALVTHSYSHTCLLYFWPARVYDNTADPLYLYFQTKQTFNKNIVKFYSHIATLHRALYYCDRDAAHGFLPFSNIWISSTTWLLPPHLQLYVQESKVITSAFSWNHWHIQLSLRLKCLTDVLGVSIDCLLYLHRHNNLMNFHRGCSGTQCFRKDVKLGVASILVKCLKKVYCNHIW